MDFEAVETALRDGSREVARDAPGGAWTPTAPTRARRRSAAAAASRLARTEKKTIATRFGKVRFGRRRRHCAGCGRVVVPRDQALGVAGESYSPGLLRLVALFNAELSARRASKPVGESLRIPVGPSQVGRKAKLVGERVQEWEKSETAPLDPGASTVGLAVDGTGIPAG